MSDISFRTATDEDVDLFQPNGGPTGSQYDPIADAFEDLDDKEKELGLILENPMTHGQASALRTHLYHTREMKEQVIVNTARTGETDDDGNDLYRVRIRKRKPGEYMKNGQS